LALAAILIIMGFAASASAPPWLYINGMPVATTPPMVVEGSFYTPIRHLATELGFIVGWNEGLKAAELHWEGNVILVHANSPIIQVNGEPIMLSKSTLLTKGTLYIPLRAWAEALGIGVKYSASTEHVYLYSSWAATRATNFASGILEASVHKQDNLVRVKLCNTSSAIQHAIPIVRDATGRLDFAAWMDLNEGKPLTFLLPGAQYDTVLGLPAWAFDTEFVEIIWVDSTKFRGRDPESCSLLTLYVSLKEN